MGDVVIREAVAGDLDALRQVFLRSSLWNPADRDVLLANPDALELSDQAVREGRTRVAVSGDGRIVGFISTTPVVGAADEIELEDLFVDPPSMRQGIGRALVRDVVLMASRQEIRAVEVTANEGARAFYEEVGFVVVGEVQTRFKPAPRMRLDIS